MKIVVTGGAGFIGSHIVDAYIRLGHKVAVIDNLSTGFRKNINPKAKFYKADISEEKAVHKILQKEKPSIINHHAALAEVVRSMREPSATLQTNILGTANLLTAFAQLPGKNKKFIFASTGGAIYGEPKKLPASEKTPSMPLSIYGLSKQMGEDLIRFYAREFGFDYLIFRYANVYGPRQNPKGEAGVVAIFGGLLKKGKQPIIFGDGSKTRDYIYVEDVVRANTIGLKKAKNTELNLGLGREISDRTVFGGVANFFDFQHPPKFAPFRSGEVRRIALDARRATKVLGWRPRIAFAEGVVKALKAYA